MPEIRSRKNVSPYWTSECGSHEFFLGDSETVLSKMPAQSVHCVVTSPPYWPLRNYGNHDDHEIGREDSIEEYLDKMLAVFAQVRRVLRSDGTFWLNIGDSRINAGAARQNSLPFRLALAMEGAGWILRQDLIWHKPNACPDGSTMDRCTKAHEYLFLFVKQPKYYFDGEAIRSENGAVKRSVWSICPEKIGTKHKAIFPRELVRPCILAGTSEFGCCWNCGAQAKRIVEKIEGTPKKPAEVRSDRDRSFKWSRNGITGSLDGVPSKTSTLGWEAACDCGHDIISPFTPCRVLDPFCGSGTVAVVSKELGRRSVGIELSEEYLKEDAIRRMG